MVQGVAVQQFRLVCSDFWVDVRLLEVNGRWIGSANTVNGPSLGCGTTRRLTSLKRLSR